MLQDPKMAHRQQLIIRDVLDLDVMDDLGYGSPSQLHPLERGGGTHLKVNAQEIDQEYQDDDG